MLEDVSTKNPGHRSDLVPLGSAREVDTFVGMFQKQAGLALVRMERIRREDCGSCRTGSTLHRRCTSRDDASVDHGFDHFAFCKHAASAVVAQREKERLGSRSDRLRRAQVGDPAILKLVPPAVHSLRAPSDWFGDVFDAQANELASATVEDFVQRKLSDTFLVLVGAPGSGKSLLAAWGLAMLDRGGFWLPASHVSDGESWRAARHRAMHSDLLVIDDLGREDDGKDGWVVEAIKGLMCDRLDGPGLTICTSNLSGEAFGARYTGDPSADDPSGTRLLSRLRQRSRWVRCGNTDLRKASKFRNTENP